MTEQQPPEAESETEPDDRRSALVGALYVDGLIVSVVAAILLLTSDGAFAPQQNAAMLGLAAIVLVVTGSLHLTRWLRGSRKVDRWVKRFLGAFLVCACVGAVVAQVPGAVSWEMVEASGPLQALFWFCVASAAFQLFGTVVVFRRATAPAD